MKTRVVCEWLTSCSGCEIAILNLGTTLVDLLTGPLQIVHLPALIDSKYFGPLGTEERLSLPEGEVGILTGAIRNEEQLEIAHEIRNRCQVLIALGTCATHGGIPAQVNAFSTEQMAQKVYGHCVTTPPAALPQKEVPALKDRIYAVDEVIDVDIQIPGCPPHPDWIADAVLALLDGKTSWSLPERSVCDTCQATRRDKAGMGAVKRSLSNAPLDPDEPPDRLQCLMEQGYLCMGTVTRAGCAGKTGRPRCITARMPCRGCFGPIREGAEPLVDMLNAMASNGFDVRSVPDRKLLFNRFTGAHGTLWPTLATKQTTR